MTSENSQPDTVGNPTLNDLLLSSKANNDDQLNVQMRKDFMSYCYSFLTDDEEARQCIEIVWNKYLQSVGDAALLSAYFDTLPFHVKTSVLPKYQSEIVRWCESLFHIRSRALLCSIYYSETFQRVIRYILKPGQFKKGIIYVPTDFDPNLKVDLSSSISNIKFEQISNDQLREDLMDIQQLEAMIQRDSNDSQAYPLMVIANAGSALFGRCDQLTKMKKLCEEHDIWLHVIGDLLGSLALLSTPKNNLKFSCDSLTMDIMKLFGIQNLPYLTLFLQSTSPDEENTPIPSHSLYDFILHSPSISFLSVWSMTQRCSNANLVHHMKQSFELTNTLITQLKQIKSIEILNDEENQEPVTYQRICSGDAPTEPLPKPLVIFRFQFTDLPEATANSDDFNSYIGLLNLWLFDKLSQQHPKMNLELLKTTQFQSVKTEETLAHAHRFAPLEHLLDVIDQNDLQSFVEDVQRYTDILVATMTARISLPSAISMYENLVSVPLPNWAGIGALRYIPSNVNLSEPNETSIYEINSIQAELARQLQTNDSAFSLGGGSDEHDAMFYLRLGMIRKREDLDVLLQKISNAGRVTETSLKYIEDMAEKIKVGIEKVQKDLYDENLQLLAQDGLLRQLPLVSNLLSWWSPAPSASPLATKGRSFDLNSGRVESTEETYTNRMQIQKQSSQPSTHNDPPPLSPTSDQIINPNQ